MVEPRDPIRLEQRDDGVALLTFDDPERRNAMTEAMGTALSTAVERLAANPDLRAVVLTGAGQAFSAGGDLGMIEAKAEAGRAAPGDPTRSQQRTAMHDFYRLFLAVRQLPCPTLAALNGAAIGAGMAVALACDLRIAARQAKLGLNFTRLGIHPGMGSSWTLPRLVGPAHAADLLFTGRLVTGEEAERLGMVNRAVEREAVLSEALAWAEQIASSAPLAVRGTKRALEHSRNASLEDQLAFEAQEQALCYESADLAEGLAAARARRAPRFEGI